jgi:CO/xanthine dehydrogenase FAD-binding subunit
MTNVEKYIRPDNLEETLINIAEEGALVIAGGTTVTITKFPNAKLLVDLSAVEELKIVEVVDNKLIIGSMVTMTEIYKSCTIEIAALKAAARAVSSTPIRNAVTIGGEIARGVYWTDLPVVLLALDTDVELSKKGSKRTVNIAELYSSHPSKVIKKDEIITKVIIPLNNKNSSYFKFAKTNVDYAIVNVASSLNIDKDGKIIEAFVVLGAVNPLASRIEECEELLMGKTLSMELIEQVAKTACEAVKYRSDFRVSGTYQKQLVNVLVKRSLVESSKIEVKDGE